MLNPLVVITIVVWLQRLARCLECSLLSCFSSSSRNSNIEMIQWDTPYSRPQLPLKNTTTTENYSQFRFLVSTWNSSMWFKVPLLWNYKNLLNHCNKHRSSTRDECIAETTFIPDVDYLQGSFSIQSEPEFLLRRFEFSSDRSYFSESRIIFL